MHAEGSNSARKARPGLRQKSLIAIAWCEFLYLPVANSEDSTTATDNLVSYYKAAPTSSHASFRHQAQSYTLGFVINVS